MSGSFVSSSSVSRTATMQYPYPTQGYMNVFQLPPVTMATGPPHYKIILCGEYGVGKSSIFRRFMNDSFIADTGRKSTVGLDQCSRMFSLSGADIKLTLWDTGGMERMSFIGSSYYRGADAALLCYSIENRETFTILSQYILDIVMNAEGAKIFLCGNMSDSKGDNCVSETDVANFVQECTDVLSGVYRVSCRDNAGVMDMFTDIARILHDDSVDRMTMRRGFALKPSLQDAHENKKKKCLLL